MSEALDYPMFDTLFALNIKINKQNADMSAHTEDDSVHLPETSAGDAGKFLKSTGEGTWELDDVDGSSAITQADIENIAGTEAGLITGERFTQGLNARHIPRIMRGTTTTVAGSSIKEVTVAAPYNTVTAPVVGDMLALTFSGVRCRVAENRKCSVESGYRHQDTWIQKKTTLQSSWVDGRWQNCFRYPDP